MTNTTVSRRIFTCLGLGLIAATALTACGGGGSSDSDTSSKVNLRKAFDQIQYRMTEDEVRAVVGRHEDDESSFSWTEGTEFLSVTTRQNDANERIAVGVMWRSAPGAQTLVRTLSQGE